MSPTETQRSSNANGSDEQHGGEPAVTEAVPAVDDCWFAMVVALVDIWRDGNYNAPDKRTYVPGALKDVMLEAEKMLEAHRTRIAAAGNHADARSDDETKGAPMNESRHEAQTTLTEIKRVSVELERAYAGKDYSPQALFSAVGLLNQLADEIVLADTQRSLEAPPEPPRDLVGEASAALEENPRNSFAADVLRLSIEERQRRDVGTTKDKPHGPVSAREMNRFYGAAHSAASLAETQRSTPPSRPDENESQVEAPPEPKERSTALPPLALEALNAEIAYFETGGRRFPPLTLGHLRAIRAALSHRSRPETDALSSDRASAGAVQRPADGMHTAGGRLSPGASPGTNIDEQIDAILVERIYGGDAREAYENDWLAEVGRPLARAILSLDTTRPPPAAPEAQPERSVGSTNEGLGIESPPPEGEK